MSTVPWVVWGFFKLITPFIDPVTREKLKFNEDMKQYVPPAQLWSADWGGEMDFEYDHEQYWPALNALCAARRAEKNRRWVAGGKLVGESEDFLAGGTDVSVEGVTYDPSSSSSSQEKKTEGVAAVEEQLAATTLDEKKTVTVEA